MSPAKKVIELDKDQCDLLEQLLKKYLKDSAKIQDKINTVEYLQCFPDKAMKMGNAALAAFLYSEKAKELLIQLKGPAK